MPNQINPAQNFERSTKEYIVLSLCLAGALLLLPFAVHRIVAQDPLIALLDCSAVLTMAGLFAFVYKTGKTIIAAWILTLVFIVTMILTIALKGTQQILWCYPATVGVYYLISAHKAAAVNAVAVCGVYFIIRDDLNLHEQGVFIISLMAINVFTAAFAVRYELQKRQLEQLSFIDALTAAGNKRAFDVRVNELVDSKAIQVHDYSMILLDIDYFKRVNDTYGHVKGDEVLTKLASLIKIELHDDEQLYRIGGEEYVIFPLKKSESETEAFAEKVRDSVEKSILNDEVGLTISCGVASYHQNESATDWLARADAALYAAKRSGRNRTASATSHT